MSESIFQFVRDELEAIKPRWEDVADATGIPLATVIKIARGYTENPGVKHIEAIADYFRRAKKKPLDQPEAAA